MLSRINSFSRNYFDPSVNYKHCNAFLKGLKIASYISGIVPVVVALVWGGSVLAGRIKRIFAGENSTTSKVNKEGMEALKVEENYESFINDVFLAANLIKTPKLPEYLHQELFDKEIEEISKEIEFMKTTLLDDIIIKVEDQSPAFTVSKKGGENIFINFSNRESTRNELRGSILRDNIISKQKENKVDDKTLYQAIEELANPTPLETTEYKIFEAAAKEHYPNISKETREAVFLKILESMKNGEKIDTKKDLQILQEINTSPNNSHSS